MRKFSRLFLLLPLLGASLFAQTWSHISAQSGGVSETSAATSASITLTTAPSVGNVVWAVLTSYNSTGSGTNPSSISIKDGSALFTVTETATSAAGGYYEATTIAYWISTGTPSTSVTATWTGSNFADFSVDTFSPSSGTAVYDKSAVESSGACVSGTASLPTLTPTNSGELLIAGGVDTTASLTAPASGAVLGAWTGGNFSTSTMSNTGGATEYTLSASAATAVEFTCTGATDVYNATEGAFYISGGTPTVTAPTFSLAAGTYNSSLPRSTTVATSTSGAYLCVTTCNTSSCTPSTPAASTPGSCSTGTQYSTNSQSLTLPVGYSNYSALGTKSGDTNSSVTTSGQYDIVPTISTYNGNTVGSSTGNTSHWNGVAFGSGTSGDLASWNGLISPPATTGGTFTLRYSTPVTCTASSGTTCALSLTSKPIIAGDLLTYLCGSSSTSSNYPFIKSVSDVSYIGYGNTCSGNELCLPVSTYTANHSGGAMSGAYVISSSAESTTDTITMNGSTTGTDCAMYEWEYTGTPEFDGANNNSVQALSATLVAPTFTPSSGSNNDLFLQQSWVSFAAPASINDGFTLHVLNYPGWAYLANSTSSLGPTFTWSSAQTNISSIQMEFGFNVSSFSNLMFANFSGTNGATVTSVGLSSGTYGLQGGWTQIIGSGSFVFSTSASDPSGASTGRLASGVSYTDTSTTGIDYPTSLGNDNAWAFTTAPSGYGYGILSLNDITASINEASTLPQTDGSYIDSFEILGGSTNDFLNAMLAPNTGGTERGVQVECAGEGNHGWIQLTTGTFYHFEIYYSSHGPVTATFSNGSASISATNTFQPGNIVELTTTGTLPTGFSTSTLYYVLATGLTPSAFELSASLGGTAISAGSAGSGTQTATGTHVFYVYSGWSSPSSPGALITTVTCPATGYAPSAVAFGNNQVSNPVTSGYHVYFDTLQVSLDGENPL